MKSVKSVRLKECANFYLPWLLRWKNSLKEFWSQRCKMVHGYVSRGLEGSATVDLHLD